jgi:hypothetical protein
MLENIIKQQEAAVARAVAKTKEQKARMVELGEFNKQFLVMKAKKIEDEKYQDRKIMEYLAKQQAALEKRLEMEEKLRLDKEAETARLRAKQEKMQDLTAAEGISLVIVI